MFPTAGPSKFPSPSLFGGVWHASQPPPSEADVGERARSEEKLATTEDGGRSAAAARRIKPSEVSAFDLINEFRKQLKPSPLLNQPAADSDDDEPAARETTATQDQDFFVGYERPVSNQFQLLQPMPLLSTGGRRGAARKAAAASFLDEYINYTNNISGINPALGTSMSRSNAGEMITEACWIASRAWCSELLHGKPEMPDLAHLEWAELVLLQLCSNEPIVVPEALLWSTVKGFVMERQWSYRVNGPLASVHPWLTFTTLLEYNRQLKLARQVTDPRRLNYMFITVPRVNYLLLATYATPSPDVRPQTKKTPSNVGGGSKSYTSIAAMSRIIGRRPKSK